MYFFGVIFILTVGWREGGRNEGPRKNQTPTMHSPCRVSGVQIQPTTGTSGSLAVWIDELDNIKQLTTCSCPGGGMGTRDSLAANSFTLSSDNLLALSCASKLQKCTEENDLRNDNTHIRAVLKTY